MSVAPQQGTMFSWIPIYAELAKKVLSYRNRQPELVTMLNELQEKRLPVGSTTDYDDRQQKSTLTEIDPFTFFASFNRGARDENRRAILSYFKTKFGLQAAVPTDFDGIPVVSALASWFFPYKAKRAADDIASLWSLAEAVVQGPPAKLDPRLYERCLQILTVGPAKLSMGMFWLNPRQYIAWDANNRRLFQQKGIAGEIETLPKYLQLLNDVNAKIGGDYPEISRSAWELANTEESTIVEAASNGPTQPVVQSDSESRRAQWESVPINLILYGPPGTGKTYQMVERTVSIIEPGFSGDRTAHKHRFDELIREGRVEFVTFHQSYSYEDFVEGIRPLMEVDDESGVPRYECRPGTFKRLVINALFDCLEAADATKTLVPFDSLWKALLEKIETEPDAKYPGLTEKTSYQLSLTPRGNIEGNNVISNKTFLCSRKILEPVFDAKRAQDSVTVSDVMEVVARGCHSQFVAALFNELRRIEKSQSLASAEQRRKMPHTNEEKGEIVQRFLTEGANSGYQLKPTHSWNKYVLVIDEINRGNISKVLGELITLIEPDKRLSVNESESTLVVTLPYSGEKFAIPANLFVLATMNTADKSIALVDLALRRRFEFEELGVDLSVCRDLTRQMQSALQELNRRIILRKDRDHQIGHAYFINVTDEASFNRRFRRQIIPLLQEYFYNDWEGLRYVLGETATSERGFIRKLGGADVKEARTKWQWFFDAGDDDLNCLDMLSANYQIA